MQKYILSLFFLTFMISSTTSMLYSAPGADEESGLLTKTISNQKKVRCYPLKTALTTMGAAIVAFALFFTPIGYTIWADNNPKLVPNATSAVNCVPCGQDVRYAKLYMQTSATCEPIGQICLRANQPLCAGSLQWDGQEECEWDGGDTSCDTTGPNAGALENTEAFLGDNRDLMQEYCPGATSYHATIMNNGRAMANGTYGIALRCKTFSSGLATCDK